MEIIEEGHILAKWRRSARSELRGGSRDRGKVAGERVRVTERRKCELWGGTKMS